MLYVIKNAEVPEKAMDKARLVLMANLRFAKSGKLLLDRLFFTPGEIWVPASSMAGMRFVAALAILMGFAGGNPDGLSGMSLVRNTAGGAARRDARRAM